MNNESKAPKIEDVIGHALSLTAQVKDPREAAIVKRYLEDAWLRVRFGGVVPK